MKEWTGEEIDDSVNDSQVILRFPRLKSIEFKYLHAGFNPGRGSIDDLCSSIRFPCTLWRMSNRSSVLTLGFISVGGIKFLPLEPLREFPSRFVEFCGTRASFPAFGLLTFVRGNSHRWSSIRPPCAFINISKKSSSGPSSKDELILCKQMINKRSSNMVLAKFHVLSLNLQT